MEDIKLNKEILRVVNEMINKFNTEKGSFNSSIAKFTINNSSASKNFTIYCKSFNFCNTGSITSLERDLIITTFKEEKKKLPNEKIKEINEYGILFNYLYMNNRLDDIIIKRESPDFIIENENFSEAVEVVRLVTSSEAKTSRIIDQYSADIRGANVIKLEIQKKYGKEVKPYFKDDRLIACMPIQSSNITFLGSGILEIIEEKILKYKTIYNDDLKVENVDLKTILVEINNPLIEVDLAMIKAILKINEIDIISKIAIIDQSRKNIIIDINEKSFKIVG